MNHSGKLVLIKYALSSVPIYQASVLLAPKYFTDKISKYLKSFMCIGREGNEKQFHLVNYNVVRIPKKEGGL